LVKKEQLKLIMRAKRKEPVIQKEAMGIGQLLSEQIALGTYHLQKRKAKNVQLEKD